MMLSLNSYQNQVCKKSPMYYVNYNNRDDNLGDQFIFQSLVNALKEFGTIRMPVDPPKFVEGINREEGKWRSRYIRAIQKLSGRAIFQFEAPGASLWPDSQHYMINAPQVDVRNKISRWLSGKKVAIGRSVIPSADHSWSHNLDWVGVRDHASLEALRDAGHRNVYYFPDLSFLAKAVPLKVRKQLLIGLSFRERIPESKYSTEYSTNLRIALTKLMHVVMINKLDCFFFHQVTEDEHLSSKLSSNYSIQTKKDRLTLGTYQSFYESCSIVISNRLHCLLIGAYCGAVPIALTSSNHTKLVSLYNSIGWNDLIIYTDKYDKSKYTLSSVLSNISSFQQRVQGTFQREHKLGFDLICKNFCK